MKIYFLGSISGKRRYLENYKQIVKVLGELGVELIENTINPTVDYVTSLDDEAKISYYKQVLEWINQVDIVVAEASYPSLGVGYEISLAIEKGKPVIVLYAGGHSPHLLEGVESDKLMVLKYTFLDLKSVLKGALEYAAEKQDTRFNFFISPKISNYLDWVAKTKRVPRAVYLRRLIEEDMRRSEVS